MRTTSRAKRKPGVSESAEMQSSSSTLTTPLRKNPEETPVVGVEDVEVGAVVVVMEIAETEAIEETSVVVGVAMETEAIEETSVVAGVAMETEAIEETSVVVGVAMETEAIEETSVVVVEDVVEIPEVSFVVAGVTVVVADPKATALPWRSTTRVPSPASAESKCPREVTPGFWKKAQSDIHNYFYFDRRGIVLQADHQLAIRNAFGKVKIKINLDIMQKFEQSAGRREFCCMSRTAGVQLVRDFVA